MLHDAREMNSAELVQEVTKQTEKKQQKTLKGGSGIQSCSNILSKMYSFSKLQNDSMQKDREVWPTSKQKKKNETIS